MKWLRGPIWSDWASGVPWSWLSFAVLGGALLLVTPAGQSAFAADADAGSGEDAAASSRDGDAAAPSTAEDAAASGVRDAGGPNTGDAGGTNAGDAGSADSPAGADETHSLSSYKSGKGPGLLHRFLSFFGIFALLAVALALSTNRSSVDWELVAWGVGLQLAFAGLIFLEAWGQQAIMLGIFLVWGWSSDEIEPIAGLAAAVIGVGAFHPWMHDFISGGGPELMTGVGFLIYAAVFAVIGTILWVRGTSRTFVLIGIGIQIVFAGLLFFGVSVQGMFDFAGAAVSKLLDFTDAGSEFLFDFGNPMDGHWERSAKNFAFEILPTIIFFSTLMTILYYLGIMQVVVRGFALLMRKTMGISGAESLSASANIFVGQTEAPLVIKPYVEDMTMSELSVVMTGGFATVAGGVMAAYVGMLEPQFPDIAKHLITASVMSAPAALVVAKIIYPETEEPETAGDVEFNIEAKDENVVGAAARGASEGLELALNVGAMLLAFLALIALANYVIAWPGMQWNMGVLEQLAAFYQERGMPIPEGCSPDAVAAQGQAIHDCARQMATAQGAPDPTVVPHISLEKIFGYIFWPFAFVMGVPVSDCFHIGQLMGEKMILNEFVAYASLADMLNSGIELHRRSVIIATYSLCGFANFSSIGIQLGGIGGIAPSRKGDLSKIALRAMFGGTIAAMMTATVAGVLIP